MVNTVSKGMLVWYVQGVRQQAQWVSGQRQGVKYITEECHGQRQYLSRLLH